MAFFDGLKGIVVKWLGVVPANTQLNIVVRENTTKEVNTLKNELWYRGDPAELEQFYKQVAGMSMNGFSSVSMSRFWAATPSTNELIRKFHSGIPKLIIDKLAGIVSEDMNEPDMDQAHLSRWKEIETETNFDEILKDAIVQTLTKGDGAFKICVDSSISDCPLIEFYSGNNVDYVYKRGHLMEIIFYTDYWKADKHYKLFEHYGRGYVNYELLNDMGSTCDLDIIDETSGLQNVSFEGDYIMGVPLRFKNSSKFKDRGESIIEGKGDIFDALDEVLSSWLDALRAGRVKQYIPDNLIPRNPEDGSVMKPDVFNPYIRKGSSLAEDAQNVIEVIQGKIDYDAFVTTYITFLDCALQGLISPSTLGIDVKKLDNAESQREKEKTTMYTRDSLIGTLSKALPKLVDRVLQTDAQMHKVKPEEKYGATFEWGQYANPSFEAMVETIGKARMQSIMSIEQCVEELYGDTMSDEDKAEEVCRLKAEQAPPMVVDEPAVNDDEEEEDSVNTIGFKAGE